jgi:hypothetical protein
MDEIFEPYERLVKIKLLGVEREVPENNSILRGLQFLDMESISYGDFCWNGECTNCQIWYHMKGQSEQNDRPALSCRLECEEGMVITKLSRFIELEGITK